MRNLNAARRTDLTRQRELRRRRCVQMRRAVQSAAAARGRETRATFPSHLPVTACRVEFPLTHSKQRTAPHSTRHRNAPPSGRFWVLAPRASTARSLDWRWRLTCISFLGGDYVPCRRHTMKTVRVIASLLIASLGLTIQIHAAPQQGDSQIKQKISRTAKKAAAQAKVNYQGAPQFVRIPGTTITYATNTPQPVLN